MLHSRILCFYTIFNFVFVSKGFQLTHHVPCENKNNIVQICSTKLKATPITTNNDNDSSSVSVSSLGHDECGFISPLMKVYIEDTDAYGVMYNGNYVRAYERALECVFNEDNDWFVEKVTNHQFKNSPVLGDEFVIQGQKVDNNDDKSWNLEMKNVHDESIVYNTATLTIKTSTSVSTNTTDTLEEEDLTPKKEYPFHVFRDEMVSLGKNDERMMIPCRNILNLFERSRTDSLGGPDSLRRMEMDDGIVWVVTRIDDMKVCCCDQHSSKVVVSNQMSVKRNGMIVEFHHSLLSSDNDETVFAKGKITVVALDAQTRRPKRKMPPHILQMLNQ